MISFLRTVTRVSALGTPSQKWIGPQSRRLILCLLSVCACCLAGRDNAFAQQGETAPEEAYTELLDHVLIDLDLTVGSLVENVKSEKVVSKDGGQRVHEDLDRLTKQVKSLRNRLDRLSKSPTERRALLQLQIDEMQLQLADMIPEFGEDFPQVKKLNQKIEMMSELLGELTERDDDQSNRVVIFKISEARSAGEVAVLLTQLYGTVASISEDTSSNSVILKVKDDVPTARAVQIQKEFDAVIRELEATAGAAAKSKAARAIHQPDPEDRKYESQTQKLLERYRLSNSEKERAQLAAQVADITAQQFDHRQARREREFQSLANRVNQLKTANTRRLANKDEIVRRRVNELLDPEKKPAWDDVEKSPDNPSVPAQANANPPQTYDPTVTEEATYSGKTVSQWLAILRRERNTERLQDVVDALMQLRQDIDSKLLITELFQAIRRFRRGINANIGIAWKVSYLLSQLVTDRRMSADDIAELIVSEVEKSRGNPATIEFLEQFLMVIEARSELSVDLQDSAHSGLSESIRTRKSRLIPQLILAAKDSKESELDVVGCALSIFDKESIVEFPELVELARNVFRQKLIASGRSVTAVRLRAANLLANSDVDTREVWEFVIREAKSTFGSQPPNSAVPSVDLKRILPCTRCIVALVGKVPEADLALRELRELVSRHFDDVLTKIQSRTARNDYGAHGLQDQIVDATKVLLISTLDAQTCVRLREQLTDAEQECSKRDDYQTYSRPILNLVAESIRRIEDASATARTERSNAGSTTRGTPVQGETYESAPNRAEAPMTPERTYDGVTYGDWLRLLETERKPERLAAAMEAASKLAIEKDLPRIARMIFLAEGGFEREQNRAVVDAGRAALNRLPAAVVFSELVAALADTESYRSGRSFQAEVIGLVRDTQFKPIFQENLDEFVTLATSAVNQEPSDRDAKLLRRIVDVCAAFNRSPKEFPELLARARHYFAKGLPANGANSEEWMEISRWLVLNARDVPDLKPVLVAQLGKSHLRVIELLGELTLSGGPDTAPDLIQYFEKLIKKVDERMLLVGRQYSDAVAAFRQGEFVECGQIVRVLSMMGENQLAGDFILRLAKYVPARSDAFKWNNDMPMNYLFQQIDAAQAVVRQFKVAADPNRSQVQLPDFFKLNGYWKLRSDQPRSVRVHGIEWSVGDDLKNGEQVNFPISYLWSDVLARDLPPFPSAIAIVDEGKTPKEISLIPRNGDRANTRRLEGIYKLTEDNLVIQLARPQTPRPTTFELEDEAAKKDQVQLTFDREKSAPSFYIGANR